MDKLTNEYSNIVVAGDLYFNMANTTQITPLHDLCELFSMKNPITEPTYWGGHLQIDVFLKKQYQRFINAGVINTHLSDEHNADI